MIGRGDATERIVSEGVVLTTLGRPCARRREKERVAGKREREEKERVAGKREREVRERRSEFFGYKRYILLIKRQILIIGSI